MASSPRNKHVIAVFSLFLTIFCINLFTMPRIYYGADANFMRMASINLLNRGSIAVLSPPEYTSGPINRGSYLYENEEKGKYYSKYGIASTLLFAVPIGLDKLYDKIANGRPFFLPPDTFIEKYHTYSRSRILFLNMFSLFLTLSVAFYLRKIVAFYTDSLPIQAFYILSCFYGTFLWNYLRAHSSEIFQILFFLMFYYYVLKYRYGRLNLGRDHTLQPFKYLLFAVIALLALCLVKLIYVLLFPLLYLFVPMSLFQRDANIIEYLIAEIRGNYNRYLLFLIAPTLTAIVVIMIVNNFKFGSPFVTGYSQWLEERQLFFPSRVAEGLYGFLFSVQKSILIHFSVLLLSFVGAKRFLKKYTFDYLFSVTIFTLYLLVNSCFIKWYGGHCYGPRYLLFILPILSLPFIETISIVRTQQKRYRKILPAAFACMLLLYTTKLQVNVNSLNFYAYYHVSDFFRFVQYDKKDEALRKKFDSITHYFKGHDFGTVAGDLIAYKRRQRPFYPMEQIPEKSVGVRDYLNQLISRASTYNYFWFGESGFPWKKRLLGLAGS